MNFLFKIFNKRPKNKTLTEIKLCDLDGWLSSNLSMSNTQLNNSFNLIKNRMSDIKLSLVELEKVKFDKDTDIIIKNRVIDNINSYIKHVNSFLSKIGFDDTYNYKDLGKFCKMFEVEIANLNATSAKSFYIINFLFSNQIGRVVKNIKELDNLVRTINNELKSDNYNKILLLFDELEKLRVVLKKKDIILEELNEKKKEQQILNDLLRKNEEKLNNIHSEEEFLEYSKLENKKLSLDVKINEIKNELVKEFVLLNRALRKMQKLYTSDVLDKYIKDPLYLFEDKNFEILYVLDKLSKFIKEKNLNFSSDEEKKILKKISNITKEKLDFFVSNYNETIVNIEKLENAMLESDVIKDIIDLNYQINFDRQKMTRLIEEINKLKTKLDSLNIDLMKEKIESNLLEVSSNEIRVII